MHTIQPLFGKRVVTLVIRIVMTVENVVTLTFWWMLTWFVPMDHMPGTGIMQSSDSVSMRSGFPISWFIPRTVGSGSLSGKA